VILWQEKRTNPQILPSAVAELVEATAHPKIRFSAHPKILHVISQKNRIFAQITTFHKLAKNV
jgi:hypothetical protein